MSATPHSQRAAFMEAVKVALASLWASKLRSFLTLLGVILATTTLLAVMGVIHGMAVYIAQQVSDMGASGFRIRRIGILDDMEPKKLLELLKKNPELTREEYDFLRTQATYTADIGMDVSRSVAIRYAADEVKDVALEGYTPNMAAISNLQTETGRFFSDSENRRHAAVAVIGNDLREKFFPGVDPVGKTITIDGRPFEVTGASKKLGSVFGAGYTAAPRRSTSAAEQCTLGGFRNPATSRALTRSLRAGLNSPVRIRRSNHPRRPGRSEPRNTTPNRRTPITRNELAAAKPSKHPSSACKHSTGPPFSGDSQRTSTCNPNKGSDCNSFAAISSRAARWLTISAAGCRPVLGPLSTSSSPCAPGCAP